GVAGLTVAPGRQAPYEPATRHRRRLGGAQRAVRADERQQQLAGRRRRERRSGGPADSLLLHLRVDPIAPDGPRPAGPVGRRRPLSASRRRAPHRPVWSPAPRASPVPLLRTAAALRRPASPRTRGSSDCPSPAAPSARAARPPRRPPPGPPTNRSP